MIENLKPGYCVVASYPEGGGCTLPFYGHREEAVAYALRPHKMDDCRYDVLRITKDGSVQHIMRTGATILPVLDCIPI